MGGMACVAVHLERIRDPQASPQSPHQEDHWTRHRNKVGAGSLTTLFCRLLAPRFPDFGIRGLTLRSACFQNCHRSSRHKMVSVVVDEYRSRIICRLQCWWLIVT